MTIVYAALCVGLLIVIARLIELQIVKGDEFHALAQSQHFGGVVLPAKRGEVLSYNSKTGETSILATNTTLDLVYVDPAIANCEKGCEGHATLVAETLSDVLVTDEVYAGCAAGAQDCPRELVTFFGSAFDPLAAVARLTGALLEPIPQGTFPMLAPEALPDLIETRRLFARSIEERISEKRVTFVPLVYGATKVQMAAVREMGIPGVEVVTDSKLIYADPERINQMQIGSIARKLSEAVDTDPEALKNLLRSRPLRYVPVMRRLTPGTSLRIREAQLASLQHTRELRLQAANREAAQSIQDPLRSVALIPEHWRFYPDGTLASQVVGFLNTNQEAQYGIERTFNPQLRGQEGLISTVSDPQGGQIVTAEQTIIDPKDGSTIVLTIDRFVQQKVEEILDKYVKQFDAESAQAIVMDPFTGRIIAMANAPIFDANNYSEVYEKEPILLDEGRRKSLVVELYHPDTREFILRAYIDDVFTEAGRQGLSEEKRQQLADIEKLYELRDIVRYYLYASDNNRREVVPTDRPDVWLKFKNNIGIGAYLNKNIQEIYEPGSVMKSVSMAIAIDQGEVTPGDTYDDQEPVKVDEYTIKNALNRYYGKVTMTQCLEFSINTCMTTVSAKLGKKLFHRSLERFGFGRITSVELEDELPGDMLPWRDWSDVLLATASFGQGVSATPLQMITAYLPLANGGKLLRPIIVDSIRHSDGTVEKTAPLVVDQVITPQTSETITAMLVSSVEKGFANVARVKGYRIAGKTGTSQIAGPGGKYETGTGSTVATFAGYGPVPNPKFVMLIKFDRPRRDVYGSQTAGPVFGEIAAYLFKYYGIPPNEQ